MKTLPAPVPKLAAAGVVALQGAAALYMALAGPTHPIPLHFSASGEVDRWGDRSEAAGFLLLMAAVSLTVALALGPLSRRRGAEANERSLQAGQILALVFTTAVCGLVFVLAYSSLPQVRGGAFGMGVMSALFFLIGAWLGKVGPNPMVGVRTPWSYASRLAWDKSNRLAGRLFFWGGLAGLLATPFTPEPLGLRAMIAFVILSAIAVVVESWRVWRADPDRAGAL